VALDDRSDEPIFHLMGEATQERNLIFHFSFVIFHLPSPESLAGSEWFLSSMKNEK